jgi:hypothetical protein
MFMPVLRVTRAEASCSSRQARVEKRRVQRSPVPYRFPALAAVVTVPGPMKAAETTDQKRILRIRFFKALNLGVNVRKIEGGYTSSVGVKWNQVNYKFSFFM